MKTTAAILLALMAITGPAQAHIVSKKVGPLLQQAQVLIAAGDYQGAAAKMKEAEAVQSTPDDATVIHQFEQLIVARASDPSPAPHAVPIITPQLPQPDRAL